MMDSYIIYFTRTYPGANYAETTRNPIPITNKIVSVYIPIAILLIINMGGIIIEGAVFHYEAVSTISLESGYIHV